MVRVSTIGAAEVTTTVSASAPTAMSAFTFAVNPVVNTMPSRRTVLNPGRTNVTVYVPGRSATMLYWPCESDTTVRTFSISAGLDASTVTPGRTAPEVSFTTPAIPWANITVGVQKRIPQAKTPTTARRFGNITVFSFPVHFGIDRALVPHIAGTAGAARTVLGATLHGGLSKRFRPRPHE